MIRSIPFPPRSSFLLCVLCVLCVKTTLTLNAQTPARPKILGISNVTVSVSDICKARDFYSELVNQPMRCAAKENPSGGAALINSTQVISLTTDHSAKDLNAIRNILFLTNNLKGLEKYLKSQHIHVTESGTPAGSYFSTKDPDGHQISFVQQGVQLVKPPAASPLSLRIIHAGFIVHDRPAMEHFYKDILGFRPYWHGGRKDDGVDDWVSFQVPDGTDWIEFMLNVPDNADKHLRGVMNHIALGVTDIQAAKAQLIKNGATLTEEPKLGRDGKWQLNLYDPDDTRIEFMEFTPKEKPCCSEFTGPHPKP